MARFAPLVFALSCLAAAPALAAGPAQLLYERSLVSAAGARCRLFAPPIAAALAAAARQTRGAAERAGLDGAAIEANARARSAAIPCGSPDLATAAARVKAAFAGYARMTAMTFPGQAAAWRAERPVAGGAGWRLRQTARTPSGVLTFGMAADADGPEVLIAVAAWPGALGASSARLVMRDPARAPGAYVDPRRVALASRIPPRAVSRVFLANARDAAPVALLPGGPSGSSVGAAFRFPAAAAEALERLDAREAFVLELVYPTRDGERVEPVPLEVGDFAAGRAFLAAGR